MFIRVRTPVCGANTFYPARIIIVEHPITLVATSPTWLSFGYGPIVRKEEGPRNFVRTAVSTAPRGANTSYAAGIIVVEDSKTLVAKAPTLLSYRFRDMMQKVEAESLGMVQTSCRTDTFSWRLSLEVGWVTIKKHPKTLVAESPSSLSFHGYTPEFLSW